MSHSLAHGLALLVASPAAGKAKWTFCRPPSLDQGGRPCPSGKPPVCLIQYQKHQSPPFGTAGKVKVAALTLAAWH